MNYGDGVMQGFGVVVCGGKEPFCGWMGKERSSLIADMDSSFLVERCRIYASRER